LGAFRKGVGGLLIALGTSGHGQPLALSTIPCGVSPSPRCDFGVAIECLCLS